MVRKIIPMLLALLSLSLTACGEFGEVIQGRVVAYDRTTTPPTAWIIKDNGTDSRNPVYDVLPAIPFTIPTNPAEMGQEPDVGLRLRLDVDAKIITMYNPETKAFDRLPFELVAKHEGVDPRRRHALVFDSATGKERVFPVVNEDTQEITIFSRRQQMLTTIRLSPEDFAKYRAKDWNAGDEVRIYYREKGKSLRFMNVTKTDFTKRK